MGETVEDKSCFIHITVDETVLSKFHKSVWLIDKLDSEDMMSRHVRDHVEDEGRECKCIRVD